MSRIAKVFFCSFCLLAVVLVVPAFALQVNAPAPDFILKDLKGQKQTLSGYRGKVVILNFWSPSCGPCVKEIPSLNEAYRKLKGDGLVVLGIAVDPAAKAVADVAARLKVEYPNLIDPEKEVYFDSYGLFGQPVSVIVDRRGVVRDKIFGSVEWCSPAVRAKLQTYLKGR